MNGWIEVTVFPLQWPEGKLCWLQTDLFRLYSFCICVWNCHVPHTHTHTPLQLWVHPATSHSSLCNENVQEDFVQHSWTGLSGGAGTEPSSGKLLRAPRQIRLQGECFVPWCKVNIRFLSVWTATHAQMAIPFIKQTDFSSFSFDLSH